MSSLLLYSYYYIVYDTWNLFDVFDVVALANCFLLAFSLLFFSFGCTILYSRTTIHKFYHLKISCNDMKIIRGLNSIRSNVNRMESSRLYGRTLAYRSPILVTVYEIRAEITFIVLCPLRATSMASWLAAFSLLGENFPSVKRGPFVLLPVTSQSALGRIIGVNKRRRWQPRRSDSSFKLRMERTALSHAFPLLQCDRH